MSLIHDAQGAKPRDATWITVELQVSFIFLRKSFPRQQANTTLHTPCPPDQI